MIDDLQKQKEALIYLLKHVDKREKDKRIHKEALQEIERLLASRRNQNN
ncbi:MULTISPECIES: hypothetical protein [Heyndrickxia]|nr:hypothetical protein [Weizmannia sp. CD-2023]MEC2225010.1 hypothetical protein [Weizmannia sp. CD-2023]